MRDARVLLTGAAGFIGANLTRRMLELGAEVHVLLRPSTDLRRIREIMPRVTIHNADLADARAVRESVQRIRPEFAFHLGATSGHGLSVDDRQEAVRSTVMGTLVVLDALAMLETRRIVSLGSSLEYERASRPMREDDPLRPASFRGAVKAASTLLALQVASSRGLALIVLRPFSVYGPWEAPSRFIPTAIRGIIKGERIALTPPGYSHDLVFVADVVDACVAALRPDVPAGEVINIGTGTTTSNEHVIEMLSRISGRSADVEPGAYAPRPWDSEVWAADVKRAERLLDWRPRYAIMDGLTRTFEWWSAEIGALS